MADHRFPQLGTDGYVSPYSDIDYSKGPKVIYGDTDVMRIILNDPQIDDDDEWGRTEQIALRQLTDEAVAVRKALFGWSSVSGLLDKWDYFEANHFDIDYSTPASSILTIGNSTFSNGQLSLATGSSYSTTELTMNNSYFKLYKVGTLGTKAQAGDSSGGAGDVVAYWYPAAVGDPNNTALFRITVNNQEFTFTDSSFSLPSGASFSAASVTFTDITANNLTLSSDLSVGGTLTVGSTTTTITTNSIQIGSYLTLAGSDPSPSEKLLTFTMPGSNLIKAGFQSISSDSYIDIETEEFYLKSIGSSTILRILTGASPSFLFTAGSDSFSFFTGGLSVDADNITLDSRNMYCYGETSEGESEFSMYFFTGAVQTELAFSYTETVGMSITIDSTTSQFVLGNTGETKPHWIKLLNNYSGSDVGINIQDYVYSDTIQCSMDISILGSAPAPYGLYFTNRAGSGNIVFQAIPNVFFRTDNNNFLTAHPSGLNLISSGSSVFSASSSGLSTGETSIKWKKFTYSISTANQTHNQPIASSEAIDRDKVIGISAVFKANITEGASASAIELAAPGESTYGFSYAYDQINTEYIFHMHNRTAPYLETGTMNVIIFYIA